MQQMHSPMQALQKRYSIEKLRDTQIRSRIVVVRTLERHTHTLSLSLCNRIQSSVFASRCFFSVRLLDSGSENMKKERGWAAAEMQNRRASENVLLRGRFFPHCTGSYSCVHAIQPISNKRTPRLCTYHLNTNMHAHALSAPLSRSSLSPPLSKISDRLSPVKLRKAFPTRLS